MAITLTQPPETPNMRVLAAWKQEEFTGLSTANVTVSLPIDVQSGLCLVFLNGALVRPSTISISGSTLTLGSALSAGDWVVIFYKARGV